MDRLLIIAAFICVTLYGLLKIFLGLKRISEKHNFATEFLQKLEEYLQSAGQNFQAYTWLTHRSNRMQNQLGLQGLVDYRPPYERYIVKNYPIIVNTLPELHNALGDDLLSGSLAGQYAQLLQEAIIRHIGSIEDAIEDQRSKLKNPVIWLREGIRSIIALPANLLEWLGLISEATAYRITSSVFFKLFSGLVAVISFIGAIFTIVLGWKQFLAELKKLFL